MCEACIRRGCTSAGLLGAPAAAPALCPCTSRQCGSLDEGYKLGIGDNIEKATAHSTQAAVRHASIIQAKRHHYTPGELLPGALQGGSQRKLCSAKRTNYFLHSCCTCCFGALGFTVQRLVHSSRFQLHV
jgi:hypothetical protein